jgi:disulfide bond formation protein DsbB
MNTAILNTIFALGTILLQIGSIALLVLLFLKTKPKFVSWIEKNALQISFIASFLGMTGSLIYSEIVKFPPCALCWYQRILMYPQVFITLVALTKKFKTEVWYYLRVLSGFGGIIALYHFIIKMTGTSPFPCSAFSVNGVDCTKQLVVEFGYINIPMMAFSIFLFIFILSFYGTKNKAA